MMKAHASMEGKDAPEDKPMYGYVWDCMGCYGSKPISSFWILLIGKDYKVLINALSPSKMGEPSKKI